MNAHSQNGHPPGKAYFCLMPQDILWILVFIAAITLLVVSSDRFIKSAETIGLAFGIPTFILGVTLVAAGTSLPELVASIIAITQGKDDIVIGNVVGSNITNVFLILGFVVVVSRNIRIGFDLLNIDLPLMIASAFMIGIFCINGTFSIFESIISLVALGAYLAYAFSGDSVSPALKDELSVLNQKQARKNWKPWLWLIVSGGALYISAQFTIRSISEISELLGIGREIISLSAVALGTSLPELSVSVMAARRGNTDLAIGNILGSNIFNTFGVLGVAGLIGTINIPNSILYFSLPVMVVASLLFFFMAQNRNISRWEGFFLLLLYAYFLGHLYITASF